MEYTKLSNILAIVISIAAPIAIVLIAVLAKGKHSILMSLFWKILFKKEMKISDENLARHINMKMDLEKLRLHYPKIHFHNTRHAVSLLDWCDTNNISTEEIFKYPEGFIFDRTNPEKIEFSIPSGLELSKLISILFSVIFSILLILLLSSSPFSGFGDSIFAKSKITDKWFFINKDKSISNNYLEEHWKANSHNCHKKLTENLFSIDETNALCELIEDDKKIINFFEKSKKETKIILLIMIPILTIGLIYFVKQAKRIISFKKLHNYLNEKIEKNKELSNYKNQVVNDRHKFKVRLKIKN